MDSADDSAISKALVSVWVRPRATITRMAANPAKRDILILASLGATAYFHSQLLNSNEITSLLSPIVVALLFAAGAIFGCVGIYVNAAIFRWSGRPFGGRASPPEMRALLAWGAVPTIAGLFLSIATLAYLGHFRGFVGEGRPPAALAMLRLAVVGLYIWSIVITFVMLGKMQGFGLWRTAANYALFGLFCVAIMAVPLAFRTFGFEPFNIPAGSMAPTLVAGDNLFVSKFSYGYSRHSLPFSLHLFDGRILFHEPERGDVAVFKLPRDPRIAYIKRIVGLPGDHIQIIHRRLLINGKDVERIPLDGYIDRSHDKGGGAVIFKQYLERLPSGRSYKIIEIGMTDGPADNTPEYIVPADHFFALGDNRDNSQDSRYLSEVGYIPKENLIGRADFIFYSSGAASGVRFDRLGLRIE